MYDFIEGEVLLFNKPFLWTSFDLVGKVRYLLKKKLQVKNIKVGHAGTLDPMATGLVIICTGKATKIINEFQDKEKEYIATIKLGSTTKSFDLETPIDKIYEYKHITRWMVEEKLNQFIGNIEQVPPLFSAKLINGKRAYEFAREAENIILKANLIFISDIKILEYELPLLKLKINCSKGTYIRGLARDIGIKLNSGGHLIELQRTAIGELKLDQALNIDDFTNILNNI
jgi:tRNA pseudouridine55 synthase